MTSGIADSAQPVPFETEGRHSASWKEQIRALCDDSEAINNSPAPASIICHVQMVKLITFF